MTSPRPHQLPEQARFYNNERLTIYVRPTSLKYVVTGDTSLPSYNRYKRTTPQRTDARPRLRAYPHRPRVEVNRGRTYDSTAKGCTKNCRGLISLSEEKQNRPYTWYSFRGSTHTMEVRIYTRHSPAGTYALCFYLCHSMYVRLWGKCSRRHNTSSKQHLSKPNVFADTFIVVALRWPFAVFCVFSISLVSSKRSFRSL